ncbi:MAG: STAS domain-containing protein [Azoarcus sp.]|nr:STAS domain-containing protein [Azoarcus sp.]
MPELSVIRLEGPLTMRTVAAVLDRDLPEGDWILDLTAIGEADSAALALLLEWLRRTHERGGSFIVRGLPPGLRSLADLYGLDEVLPVGA